MTTRPDPDAEAIRRDWETVAQDLRDALTTAHRPVYRPHAPHRPPRSWRRARAIIEPANRLAVAGYVALLLVLALATATLIVVRIWGG